MKIWSVAAATLTAIISGSAAAENVSQMGLGGMTCDVVVAKLDEGEKATMRGLILAWSTGYLSGTNAYGLTFQHQYLDLGNFDLDHLQGLIRAFCMKKPSGTLSLAVLYVMSTLPLLPAERDQ